MSLTLLWFICIVSTIVIIGSACLPTKAVERLIKKLEIHSKLNNSNVSMTINGKRLEGKEKLQVIKDFNQADFLKRYHIHRGTEEYYLDPKDSKTRFVIETKQGQKDIKLFIYCYRDHIDVVKQYKKKLIAYSLHSDVLQKIDYLSNLMRKIKNRKNQYPISFY